LPDELVELSALDFEVPLRALPAERQGRFRDHALQSPVAVAQRALGGASPALVEAAWDER